MSYHTTNATGGSIAAGIPNLEFLDENGKMTFSVPDATKTAQKKQVGR